MNLVRGSQHYAQSGAQSCVALGNFDGVHVGHQAIIDAAISEARARGARSIVFTFDPHPGAVVGRGEPPRLTTPQEKIDLIREHNPDVLIIEAFTLEFAQQSPAEFVRSILVDRLGVCAVFIGEDFAFGKERSGRIADLQAAGAAHGFSVTAVPPIEVDHERVSSTRIRSLIQSGAVAPAARRLGRPYSLSGQVVHGSARGQTLGIRTANVQTDKLLLPSAGVYATWAVVDGRRFRSVTNIGHRPTFGGGNLTIEAHLLDFEGDGDLYGKALSLGFVNRLRNEQTFDSASALVEQIQRDIAQARSELRGAG